MTGQGAGGSQGANPSGHSLVGCVPSIRPTRRVRPPPQCRTRARLALLLAACLAACNADASRYRLAGTGSHWDRAGGRPIAEELGEIYPDYFAIILDPSSTREPDLRPLRDDLEARPTQRRSYDALNAIAIGYFELNYRAEASRGGATYLADSFRATKLVAVPWRAYGEIDDGALRDAILAFFEDAASGEKLGTASTAPRLAPIVGSLRAKESDPQRTARIDALVSRLEALTPPPPME